MYSILTKGREVIKIASIEIHLCEVEQKVP
jgi:hypothetical protein